MDMNETNKYQDKSAHMVHATKWGVSVSPESHSALMDISDAQLQVFYPLK